MEEQLKIVLFEDNPEVSSNIQEILEMNDFKVFLLEADVNLKEEISLINPDLIISDIMMPKKSGFEILEELRSYKEFFDIPFIFLTAKTTYDDLRKGMNFGADDYIYKPFSSDDLIHSIKLRLEKANHIKQKIDEFSNNIAIHVPHEMRTPLVSLLGYSSLILDDYKSLSDEDVISFTERINFSAKRLHRTIEKFIQYSNLVLLELDKDDRNKFLFGNSTVEISEVIKSCIEKINHLYKREDDLKIRLETFNSKLSELSLSTILFELIDNAFKFSKQGDKVIIEGKPEDNKYKIEIFNNGKGISDQNLKKLEELTKHGIQKYNRFEHGFGLAIVSKVTNYLGEPMRLESEKDSFTKVTLRIP